VSALPRTTQVFATDSAFAARRFAVRIYTLRVAKPLLGETAPPSPAFPSQVPTSLTFTALSGIIGKRQGK